MFSRMVIDSSMLGGSIITFWKRRSNAPSFSMCWRYSSKVEAPITWSSPRANAGLKIFDASSEPVAPPAPTMVWISSIKRMTSWFFSSSAIIAFILSSNWPRYFVPATKAAKSSITTRRLKRTRDTFRWTIRRARPSTMAVLPTPGSPMRIGLFFLRLLRIWETRSISVSRPTMGSSLSLMAISVTSLPKLSKTGVLDFVLPRLEKPGPPSFRLEPGSSSAASPSSSREVSPLISFCK